MAGPGKPGRRCLLTPELHAAIIADVATGLYAAQVALRNGIHPDTLRNWVARGLQEDAQEPWASFARDFIQADIEVERVTIERIRAAGADFEEKKKTSTKIVQREGGAEGQSGGEQHEAEEIVRRRGDWKADAWFAEKRWPKRYGPKAHEQVGHGDGLPVPQIQESAAARPSDLRDLLLEPPPELEDALLDPAVRDSLLRRLQQ